MYLKSAGLKLTIYLIIRNFTTKSFNSNLKKLLIQMPKDSKHIAEIQKQRQKIKERGAKYIPGTVNLQVLGSGAPGSPATVYLFTDQSRYLFNCGEGTQRLAHEHKTKLSRLEHIFMTRTSWSRCGGLPGLSLTVQDAGVPNLTLHGPPGLESIFRAMRRFVVLKDLKVEAQICENGGVYDDSVMTVQYLPILKSNNNAEVPKNLSDETAGAAAVIDDTDYFAHENNQSNSKAKTNQNSTIRSECDAILQGESLVMSYICKIKPRPGTLSLEKCVDKGVPPGPLLGQLKNGQNVTLPNGTIVYAQDVCSPDDPGPLVILLDIPSVEYFDDFLACQSQFAKYQATAKSDEDVAALVIHFTPGHIMNMPIYRKFMDAFSPSTRHLVLNETNSFSGYVASHRIQYQLNQLNKEIYPVLHECSNSNDYSNSSSEPDSKKIKLTPKNCQENVAAEEEEDKLENITDSAKSLTCYHLRPNKGFDRSNEADLNPSEYLNEAKLLPGFTESLAELKKQFADLRKDTTNIRSKQYPKILFLGTGSCIPNKTRNVSSILIHTTKDSCILLDCGEGTAGQILRFYGNEETVNIFRKLKAIYVSHLHADHHIGLIGILQERRRILGESTAALALFAPRQISYWLNFYNNFIESIKDEYTLIHNGDLIDQPYSDSYLRGMGIVEFTTCPVLHCPHSFGVALKLQSGTKITYSGDTMPCDELIRIGQNSTILIHEATMEDELIEQAKIKMHSTVAQAIEQGQKMNAKYTILTHFSQRYAKLPRLEHELQKNVGIAFDNMEVTDSDLEHLHLLYPTLKVLFSEHCEEMEQKAMKRAFKQQRAELRKTQEV